MKMEQLVKLLQIHGHSVKQKKIYCKLIWCAAKPWHDPTWLTWCELTWQKWPKKDWTQLFSSLIHYSLVPNKDLISSLIKKWIQMENGTTTTLPTFFLNCGCLVSAQFIISTLVWYALFKYSTEKKNLNKNTKAQCSKWAHLWPSIGKIGQFT